MLVFVAIVGVILMGFLALTLDVGAGSRQRRIAQAAADAGAMGGGQEILRKMSHDTIYNAAMTEATRNGFLAAEVTVNHPPSSGHYKDSLQYVEVIVHSPISTLFGSIFNINSLDVRARGVAGVAASSLNCVYTLDPTGADALWLDGDLTANCGISVNSSNANALWVKPGKDLYAPATSVSGGKYGGGQVHPAPSTGAAPINDPLGDLVFPTDSDCSAHPTTLNLTSNTTLSPGVYCGGINIANGSTTATLQPGNYIIRGGGLTVATSGRIIGDSVTIFFTTGAVPYSGMSITNSCTATLTAPTSGAYKGILFFADPATVPLGYINTFSCAGTQVGSFYFPNETVYFSNGNGKLTIQGAIVAYSMRIKSGSAVEMLNDPTSNNAIQRLALVEM
jgi:hypothetical protein